MKLTSSVHLAEKVLNLCGHQGHPDFAPDFKRIAVSQQTTFRAINDQSGAQQFGPAFGLPRAGFYRNSVPSVAARPGRPERAIG
jgi:hypothetical protein